MENQCPKCHKKLSIFYIKPICPSCGCNIMEYNMTQRLEADAQKAEAQWDKLYRHAPKKMRQKYEESKYREEENDEKTNP